MEAEQREAMLKTYRTICEQRAAAKTKADKDREFARWEGACFVMCSAGFLHQELDREWWAVSGR